MEVIQTKKDAEVLKKQKHNASNVDKAGKAINMWSTFASDCKDHSKMTMAHISKELAPTLDFFHDNEQLSSMLQAQYNGKPCHSLLVYLILSSLLLLSYYYDYGCDWNDCTNSTFFSSL